MTFFLITAALFHSFFVRKNTLYSKNIRYAYNFYVTDLRINAYRCVFRTQSNNYYGASLQKLQKSFIVDIRLGRLGLWYKFS